MWRALTITTALATAMMIADAHWTATAAAPQRAGAQLMARAQAAGRVRVIVGVRGASLIDVAAAASAGRVERMEALGRLPYFSAIVDAAALNELAASPFVTSIVEDVPRPATLGQSVALVGGHDAWEAGYGGAGWTVAILDTGVEATHPFLNGKVVEEACFSTTDTSGMTTSASTCPGGLSTASGAGSSAPCQPYVNGCDHGTHVAGIAAGSGASMSGVARDASILSIQVFSRFASSDCGGSPCLLAWDSDVLEALDYVYGRRGELSIAAVNLSLGNSLFGAACDDVSPPLTSAINQLRGAGIATVVAAGNAGSTSSLSFPACISTAVSVGSTTKADAVSSFSNASAWLSLLAPGEMIQSSMTNGSYGARSGTSMAAPHVAGAWAVLKQRKPGAGVAEILDAMRANGAPLVDGRPGSGQTLPRLRVRAALDALVVSEPYMAIDSPAAGNQPVSFTVAGWAVDRAASTGNGVDVLHIWAYPRAGGSPTFAGAVSPGEPRDDIAAALGAQFRNSGYRVTVSGLAPGSYTLVVFAHSVVADGFNKSHAVDVTIPQSWPQMAVDGPAQSSTLGSSFTINGWAIDRMATSGSGVDAVHVWAFPINGGSPLFAGQAAHGQPRSDVGNMVGHQFDPSGYTLTASGLAAGTYDLVIYAHSAVTGTFNQSQTVRVTVQ
jgi:subtilisin